MFTPELKVKRLLDSLAYFILQLNMTGIETKYKQLVTAQREIPVSSCPKYIENFLYATGVSSEVTAREEEDAFNILLDSLGMEYKPKEPKQKSMFSKKLKLGIRNGVWCRVDTDGKFLFNNNEYLIDDQEIQYQPIQTAYGDYYAMDKILVADGKFYDMNYNEINVRRIGGILPYESFVVGTET